MKKKISIGDIVFVAVLLVLILIFTVFKVKYIRTGSMEPTLHVGAVVIVNPHVKPDKGDIAMYETDSSEVIHRVMDINDDGSYMFKGDNVADPDINNPVPRDAVTGPVIFKLNIISPLIRAIHHI